MTVTSIDLELRMTVLRRTLANEAEQLDLSLYSHLLGAIRTVVELADAIDTGLSLKLALSSKGAVHGL